MLRLIICFTGLIFTLPIFAASYKIDPKHSRMEFRIKHLVVKTVTGKFTKFEGSGEFDDKSWRVANAKITIDAASIDTNDSDRDNHLRSPDFFDAKKYPHITFEVTDVIYQGEGAAKAPKTITGKLTMKGITKDISLTVGSAGAAVDAWGNETLGFDASTTIDRTTFGLDWKKEGFDPIRKVAILMLSNDVQLDISINATKVVEKKDPNKKKQ